jgi:putative transcriptional regulator
MIKPRIGRLLRESKYKREFIIKELGISKNTLTNWIAGNTYPTIDKAFLLADLLEVTVEELYDRKKDPIKNQ